MNHLLLRIHLVLFTSFVLIGFSLDDDDVFAEKQEITFESSHLKLRQ